MIELELGIELAGEIGFILVKIHILEIHVKQLLQVQVVDDDEVHTHLLVISMI
jgi:hypothetical protein